MLHSATHSLPPPASTSDSLPLSNRQHCCRGCHGVGLLSIMSHAPSQPDAPPGPPACVRSRGPRDVSFGNHERPTASCRGSREKVGAVESHQEKKNVSTAQRAEQSVFSPWARVSTHGERSQQSDDIYTDRRPNKLMMDFMIRSNTDNTDNKENTLFDSYR